MFNYYNPSSYPYFYNFYDGRIYCQTKYSDSRINTADKHRKTEKTSFSKEEAAAIALLLGIDFTKSKYDLDEFWMGVNTELEHGMQSMQTNVTGDDPILTGKIALAHLNEFPDYYKRLKILEDEAKAYWSKRFKL